jgi:hypothetical protein
VSTYVAVFALIIAYAALIAAYCALRTLARLRRASVVLSRGARGARDRESLLEATTRHAELTATIADELRVLREYVDQGRQEDAATRAEQLQGTAGALCHVALVRYDAFADLSGRMSFSLALLDDRGDGVTISALAGRSDTRVYAKSVAAGQGEHELSPEELQAVQAALPKKGLLGRKAS